MIAPSAKNLLIFGEPRVGKSTLIKSVIQELGNRVGGFFTEEIRKEGERIGFQIITLDGQKAPLAEIGFKSDIQVGKYGVDLRGLETIGVSAIERALQDKEIIVIDEIGNMEVASKKFCDVVLQALESDRIVLATIHMHPTLFTDEIKGRPDITLFHLTAENREAVQSQVARSMRALFR